MTEVDFLQAWLSMPTPPADDVSVPLDARFERAIMSSGDHYCAGWQFQDGQRWRWYGPWLGRGETPEAAIANALKRISQSDVSFWDKVERGEIGPSLFQSLGLTKKDWAYINLRGEMAEASRRLMDNEGLNG